MPRFFIEVVGPRPVPDTEGQDYRYLADACADAVLFLADILDHHRQSIWPGDEWTVDVRDEHARSLFELTLSMR